MNKLYTGGAILFFLIVTSLAAIIWSNSGKSFSDFSSNIASDAGEAINTQANDISVKGGEYLSGLSGKAKDNVASAYDVIKKGVNDTVEYKITHPVHEVASHYIKSILLNYPILTKDDIKDIVSNGLGRNYNCN